MAKRLTPIRHGIRYQDLVAAEALLEMVNGAAEPPIAVRLEDRSGGSFDDVVVVYPDRIVWKQVKWAQNPASDPLTIGGMCSAPEGKRSLIRKFADSYREILSKGLNCQLELVTNRSPDDELRRYLHGPRSMLRSRMKQTQIKRLAEGWEITSGLDASELKDFMGRLSFLVNSPDIERRTKDIQAQIRLLGCPKNAFSNLLENISSWACDEEESEIDRADVQRVLGSHFDIPSNDFQLPAIHVARPEASQLLLRRIESLESGYFVLLGAPGSGKSTLLNTLRDQDSGSFSCDFIVYNCYTGTSDNFMRTRSKAGNFAKFLARELYDNYSSSGLTFQASADDVDVLLSRASQALNGGRRLVLILDGLDYARRYSSDPQSSVSSCLPLRLPENIVVLVSAQVREQLPSHLQNLPPSHVIEAPSLSRSCVESLLEAHGIFSDSDLNPDDREQVSREIHSLTKGRPLYVNFAARQLAHGIREGMTCQQAIDSLPPYESDIDSYYRLLFTLPEAATAREAIAILASAPFEMSMAEVAQAMLPPADPRVVDDATRSFRHLFQQIDGRFYFTHDSVRIYARREFGGSAFGPEDQIRFLQTLRSDPRVGDHLLGLLSESENRALFVRNVDCDWLAEQISEGANIDLLSEGLLSMALFHARHQEYKEATHWWTLHACLQRAIFEGELYENNLIGAWLALSRSSLVERYALSSEHFLSRVYPGSDLIDLLEQYGKTALADVLRDRVISQPPPDSSFFGPVDSYVEYLRHACRKMPAYQLFPEIVARVEGGHSGGTSDSAFYMSDPNARLDDYVDKIIRECISAGDLDLAVEWLLIKPQVLTDSRWAEHFLRLRLLKDDWSEETAFCKDSIQAVESLDILEQFSALEGFGGSVRKRLQGFPRNPLFHKTVEWYGQSRIAHAAVELAREVTICCRLELTDRLNSLHELIRSIPCKAARVLTMATTRLINSVVVHPSGWSSALSDFAAEVRELENVRLGSNDIGAAQGFVSALGILFNGPAHVAKMSGETVEFASILESTVLPALHDAGINYESGHLSLFSMLQEEDICPDTSLRLLDQVRAWADESVCHKSGQLINLATRYGEFGNVSRASRTLVAGVRAAFSYGYRKDTTFNEYLLALHAVAPYLGDQFTGSAEYATRVIMVLEEITDGRMLYYSSSYLIGVVSTVDIVLAARLGRCLWNSCRNLRPIWIAEAAEELGVDLTRLARVFEDAAPEVTLSQSPRDADSPDAPSEHVHEFVTSDTEFSVDKTALQAELISRIENASFSSGFSCMPALIKSLLAQGDSEEAVAVFFEFENALQQLFSPYPLPLLK